MIYSQGITSDGAVILKDGKMLTIDEVVDELNDYHKLMGSLSKAMFCADNEEKRNAISMLVNMSA